MIIVMIRYYKLLLKWEHWISDHFEASKIFFGLILIENIKKKKNLIDWKIDQIYFYFCLKVFIYWKSWDFSIKSFLQKKLWKVCFYLKMKQKKLFLIIGLITDILST
jgi:hypothetical protein